MARTLQYSILCFVFENKAVQEYRVPSTFNLYSSESRILVPIKKQDVRTYNHSWASAFRHLSSQSGTGAFRCRSEYPDFGT
jgi:hypothetical protein